MNKKQRLTEILFISIISCFFCICLFSSNIYADSHDLTFHLNRIVGLSDAFSEGQILPKIYPYSNNGFGYASPLFYCDLFLYPFAFIYKAGVSLIITYKILLGCLSLGTTTIAFYCTKKAFKRSTTPYITTLLYVFASYHFYDVYARAAIGEAFGIMFTPLVLYSICKILVLKKNDYILLAISFSCLVLCHLISALLFGVVFAVCIIVYLVANRKNKREILNTIFCIAKGTILALLLCAWFILPMLEQMNSQEFYLNIVDQTFNVNGSALEFKTIFNVFGRLDINGKSINDVISIGIALLVIPLAYILVKKNAIINLCLIFVLISFLFLLGIIPLPSFLSNIQFLFRMYIIIYPLLTIASAYVLDSVNNKTLKILGVVIVIYSILNTTIFTIDLNNESNDYFSNNEDENIIFEMQTNNSSDYNHSQLGGGEYLPICENENYMLDDKSILIFYPDDSPATSLLSYERNFTSIEFDLETDGNYAALPLTYYEGYRAYCDGVEINCEKETIYSKVGIYLQEGLHHYEAKYVGTTIQRRSLYLSLASSILTMILIVYNKYREK